MARMMLLTKAILAKLPVLYANEEKSACDIKVPLKLFNPLGSQSWFITEYNPETGIAFGYVTGMQCDELGYISIPEIEEMNLHRMVGIERDRYWNMNNTLEEVMDGTKK